MEQFGQGFGAFLAVKPGFVIPLARENKMVHTFKKQVHSDKKKCAWVTFFMVEELLFCKESFKMKMCPSVYFCFT